ncbi:MAG TPA: preprotein translocase subunit SecE [Candidatus Saccharibacteria bacterium]|nr:preprotein translocase subunit SecE [Candidatus Saccharibacteria bacterium]
MAKKDNKTELKSKNTKSEKKSIKLPKWLKSIFKPFLAIARYFKDSWSELQQVRWTDRRATWSLTLAVILFSGFFIALILLFDEIFNLLFKIIIN